MVAKKLASKMPPGLDVTYFTNSGSEANDLAIQMARLHTGHRDVIALRNSYHGGSPSAMGLTSHSTWKYPVGGDGNVHHAINPDPYRSPFAGTPEEIASKSAADIRDMIRFTTSGKVAAFLAEPMQGVGGVTYGAPNYLKEVYAIIRENGELCISDEVQTGFGRTGDHYWGFQNWGVVPDFVTMAKGLGNGAPIGAVTTRMEIARSLTQRIHFNTFANNPVSTAAGLAVLDIIDEDELQENCRVLGARFKVGLERLQRSHSLIGDGRGSHRRFGTSRHSRCDRRARASRAAVLRHCFRRRLSDGDARRRAGRCHHRHRLRHSKRNGIAQRSRRHMDAEGGGEVARRLHLSHLHHPLQRAQGSDRGDGEAGLHHLQGVHDL